MEGNSDEEPRYDVPDLHPAPLDLCDCEPEPSGSHPDPVTPAQQGSHHEDGRIEVEVVAEIFHREEAETRREAIDDAVEGAVELLPPDLVPDKPVQAQSLEGLLDEGGDQGLVAEN